MSEKRSRVKKFAELREEVLHDVQHDIETKELSSFANQLHRIDQEQFSEMKVESNADYHSPLHKRNDYFTSKTVVEPKLEKPVSEVKVAPSISSQSSTQFDNHYLDDFINEVKQYNVDKGYRKDEDTQSNVLSSIRSSQKVLRPFGNIDTYQNNSVENMEVTVEENETLDSVQPEVESLELSEGQPEVSLEETQIFTPSQLENLDNKEITLEEDIMSKVAQYADSEDDFVEYDIESSVSQEELLKETQQLKIQLEQQSSEVVDVKSKVDRANGLLNVLLGILVFALVVVILIFGYMLLKLNQVI